jgi:asparagine synthase (glutamine-hydrolysing)
MCGIVGYFSLDRKHLLDSYLVRATQSLSKRGPDFQSTRILSSQVGFGHTRLSIIDNSTLGNQPMSDSSGRFTIVFNGEIFNYRELKKEFLSDISFVSASDTEVLLHLYIKLGKDALKHLNGFFAFAIYDNKAEEIFLARDRFGIKPLHIYSNNAITLFSSELKAIMKFPIEKEIDYDSLILYLELNYIPGTNSILKDVKKLEPGHFAVINAKGQIAIEKYYAIPYEPGKKIVARESFVTAASELRTIVEDSVEKRLVSDVPLGSFLSGGIDSSVITACAAKQIKQLNTFSLGYRDDPYFDETYYANLVAKKFKTNHTVFPITTDEMFSHIFSVLDYIDEPFADSSAIAVYLLSHKVRGEVKVALSGDGGDELFGGYEKHRAELRAVKRNLANTLISLGLPFLNSLPRSRNSKVTNLFRQIYRYRNGLKLARDERYWQWCRPNPELKSFLLLKNDNVKNLEVIEKKKRFVLDGIKETGDINDILFADMQMVLSGDMLTKVDLMSMANGLEVRVPLLDYRVVNYTFSLPASFKVNQESGKGILREAFRNVLPVELFNRPKKGFEVPLLKWLRTGLRSIIEDDLLEERFIVHQNIFNYSEISKLKSSIFSKNPGEAPATIWALLVFQYWFKKYFSSNA